MRLSSVCSRTMGTSFTRALGEEICAHKPQLVLGVAVAVVLLVLSFVSLLVVGPSSPTYVIVVLNIVTLSCVVGVFSVAIVLCNRRGH